MPGSPCIIARFMLAIGVNPSNPRAHLLLYIFFDKLSKATGRPSMNDSKELATIKQLFASEKTTGLQPAWGREVMDIYKLK